MMLSKVEGIHLWDVSLWFVLQYVKSPPFPLLEEFVKSLRTSWKNQLNLWPTAITEFCHPCKNRWPPSTQPSNLAEASRYTTTYKISQPRCQPKFVTIPCSSVSPVLTLVVLDVLKRMGRHLAERKVNITIPPPFSTFVYLRMTLSSMMAWPRKREKHPGLIKKMVTKTCT